MELPLLTLINSQTSGLAFDSFGGGYYCSNFRPLGLKGWAIPPSLSFLSSWGPLTLLLSLAAVFVFLWLFYNRASLKLPWWGALITALAHTLFGVGSVCLFAMIENWIGGGRGLLSLYGGIFFMPLFYFAFSKIRRIPVSSSFDVFTPCLIGTLLFARINCIFKGCCLGIVIEGTSFRVPTREIELLGNFVFLLFSLLLNYKKKLTGCLYPIYMVEYGALRFILECFRESESPYPLHFGHIWSLVCVLAGAAALAVLLVRKKRVKEEIAS